MLVSEKRKEPKRRKLRYAEYYDMTDTFDNLYAQSQNGKVFIGLMEIITSDENMKLAYRSIKRNTGSHTAGVDGRTVKDLEKLDIEDFCKIIRKKLQWYEPQPVKRVEIPKPNGKMRPLGIPTLWDRVVQQCILQVLDPICEAKFHERSNGFRPNRSAENALAQSYYLAQVCKLPYVVDIDIKGFFDNVDHSKLVRQMWALGIRDKKLICIIKAMLKAPIMMPDGSSVNPTKGTPQGGILSPLLSNIVLNELDWWIDSQWIGFPTHKEYKTTLNPNGSLNQGGKFLALKGRSLKEMYMVRYADDFKIFCRDRTAADKTFWAVKLWLKDRLKLEISDEKSKVTNLKKQYTEFLGFKLRLIPKRKKYVIESRICDKAGEHITNTLIKGLVIIKHSKNHLERFAAITRYNSIVWGIHNYYCIATDISVDVSPIAYRVNTRIKHSFNRVVKKTGSNKLGRYMAKQYGNSNQIRYINGLAVAPIGYVRTCNPMHKPRKINKYTPEGRATIHQSLRVDVKTIRQMMRAPPPKRSIEYCDNRLSLYSAQYGKCAITERKLEVDEVHCHHKLPAHLGGTDQYANLVIVHVEVHRLIHCTDTQTINYYLSRLRISPAMLKKINKLREVCRLQSIAL